MKNTLIAVDAIPDSEYHRLAYIVYAEERGGLYLVKWGNLA